MEAVALALAAVVLRAAQLAWGSAKVGEEEPVIWNQ